MPYLPWNEFNDLLEDLRPQARLAQQPLAQLTWLVGGFLGNKFELEEWYTGYARAPDNIKTGLPAHLQADLDEGTTYGLVPQVAFEALKRVESNHED